MNQPAEPYVYFDGNCRQAMEFYQILFGGELNLMPIRESPAKEQFSEELHDQIMHADLRNGGFALMASDMCGMGELRQGNSVEISLNCASEEEINHLYKQLSDGGEILDDLKKQFWGDLFAMVVDRFGVRWMLSFDLTKK